MLVHGECCAVMQSFPLDFIQCVFADPPYFLSNNGSTCKSGQRVSVNKGDWDRSRGVEENHEFNRGWLAACKRVMSKNATIWASGTRHAVHSIGYAMAQAGFKSLNDITWEKPNPPPNLSCRYFTDSTEVLLWAARDRKSKHPFAYTPMREENGGKQMKSVWTMTAPGKSEKTFGKHPTQKPIALVSRALRASSPFGSVVLDPFGGSGTTNVAARSLGLRSVYIERDREYVDLAMKRLLDGGQFEFQEFSSLEDSLQAFRVI